MSDWSVGDLVHTPAFGNAVLYRIISLGNATVDMSVVWQDDQYLRSCLDIGETRASYRGYLEKPNEMWILALVANGDLDV